MDLCGWTHNLCSTSVTSTGGLKSYLLVTWFLISLRLLWVVFTGDGLSIAISSASFMFQSLRSCTRDGQMQPLQLWYCSFLRIYCLFTSWAMPMTSKLVLLLSRTTTCFPMFSTSLIPNNAVNAWVYSSLFVTMRFWNIESSQLTKIDKSSSLSYTGSIWGLTSGSSLIGSQLLWYFSLFAVASRPMRIPISGTNGLIISTGHSIGPYSLSEPWQSYSPCL